MHVSIASLMINCANSIYLTLYSVLIGSKRKLNGGCYSSFGSDMCVGCNVLSYMMSILAISSLPNYLDTYNSEYAYTFPISGTYFNRVL